MLREKAKNDESLREAMKSGMLIDDNTVFSALEEQLNKIGDSLYNYNNLSKHHEDFYILHYLQI